MPFKAPSPEIAAGASPETTRAARAVRTPRAACAALMTGSQTIPFGDNGGLYRELAAHIAAYRTAASNRRS